MSTYSAVSQLINFILLLSLGIFVLLNNPKSKVNISYAIMNFAVGFWAFFYFLWLSSTNYTDAMLYLRILMIFAATIPVFFMHFTLNLLDLNRIKVVMLPLTYLFCLACVALIINNLLFDTVRYKMGYAFWPDAGKFFYYYLFYFYAGVIMTFFLLLRSYLKESGPIKNRLGYFILGALLITVSGSLSFPLWFDIQIPPFLNPLISIYAIIVAYAILKHHLMDITVVIRKGLVYSIIVAFFVALYLILLEFSNVLIVNGMVQPTLKIVYQLFAYGALILHSTLCVVVLLNNPTKTINRIFSLLSVCVAMWILGCVIQTSTGDPNIGLMAGVLLNKFAVWTPALFLHTYYSIIGLKNIRPQLSAAYMFSFFLFVLTFTPLFASGVSYFAGARYITEPGPLYILLPLAIALESGAGLAKLVSARASATGYKRIQMDYMLFAGITIILASFFYMLLVYKLVFTPFDELLNIVYGIAIGYAILKHRLMEITVVFRKGLIYSSTGGLITGVYIASIFSFSYFINNVSKDFSLLLSLLLIIFFSLIFQPLRDRIQELIDKLFFRGKYDYQKTLKELSLAVRSIAGLDELVEKVLNSIVDVIKIRNASIYILDRKRGQYVGRKAVNAAAYDPILQADDPGVRQLAAKKEVITPDEPGGGEASLFSRTSSVIVFPVLSKNEMVGILCLGEKLSGEVYSSEDIDLLSTLCNQMGVSIENAMLYEDSLEAQRRLYQADKLATVGALAAGLAHEIKNPIAAIKGFSQVINKAVEKKDAEAIKDFTDVVPRQLDRINDIVEKLLTLSKPPKMEMKQVDINELLSDIIKLVEKQAFKSKVEIVKDFEDLPRTTADPERLTQAFLNLILNAIQSMPEGGKVEITTRIKGGDKITIEVADNGPGIPKDRLLKVFDPFYTTKETGSGLGLAVTQKAVMEHHGGIQVESRPGKGTRFIVMLPVK